MALRVFSRIMLMFLLIDMLTVTLKIQQVRSVDYSLSRVNKEFQESDFDLQGNLIAGCGSEYTGGEEGIYKSTDLGKSWQLIWNYTDENGTVWEPDNCRCVFVDSRGYFFVGVGNATIWRSTDNGTTFTKVYQYPERDQQHEFWFMREDSSGYLYVGGHFNAEPPCILKSTNNGTTWSSISMPSGWGCGDINCIYINPWTDWIYISQDGSSNLGLWRSKDQGSNWTHIVQAGGNNWNLAIHAIDAETIFVCSEHGGANDIGKITDDGTDGFKPVTKVYESSNSFPFIWAHSLNDVLWFGSGRTHAGSQRTEIVRSTDNGTNWEIVTYVNSPDQRRQIYFSTAHPEREKIIFSTNALGNIKLTLEGGIDFTPPEIIIISPKNRTYIEQSVPLEFTINETASWIGYSLDNQANATITGNTTLTGLSEGTHSIVVYTNDTSGNMGASSKIFFEIALPSEYTLTVYSSPTGVTFTVDCNSCTTPWSGTYSRGASVSLVMPETYDGCIWLHWLEDEDTNRTRTIVLTANTTLIGVFTILGDVNGDGIVDIFDIVICALAFGSRPGDPKWNPEADLRPDGLIDIFDIVIIGIHYGDTT